MDAMDNEEALRLLVQRPACVFTLPAWDPVLMTWDLSSAPELRAALTDALVDCLVRRRWRSGSQAKGADDGPGADGGRRAGAARRGTPGADRGEPRGARRAHSARRPRRRRLSERRQEPWAAPCRAGRQDFGWVAMTPR